ncbi:2-C-methyl-D-erythritol 2,4-cyclodiphosphate synthase [Chloroflexota bacterium]
MRVGIGFDIHPFIDGKQLILGGVEIPYSMGLEGHSDGDVLLHAVIDALLGATASGDIGKHFPPGNPEYKGISSIILLRRTRDLLNAKGWQTGNIDASVVASAPILQPYIESMRLKIADTLGVTHDRVSVKAKTANTLDAAGKGEGIEALAVAVVFKEGINENT